MAEEDDKFQLWAREEAFFLDFKLNDDSQFMRIHQNLCGNRSELGASSGLHTTGSSSVVAHVKHLRIIRRCTATVWEAAIAMYLFILREELCSPGCWKGLRIMELGSGTGSELISGTLFLFNRFIIEKFSLKARGLNSCRSWR
jgi:hypothetical protein